MMDIALVEARRAYEEGEVPVGCVFVAGDGSVLARGRNQTNETLNGTRHCELVCVDEILCTHSADVFKTAELFGGCGTVVPVNGVLCPVEINEGNKEEEALGLLKEFYERGNPNCPDAKRQRPL
eukprot:GEMP01106205.1.p1 GENE.GEMP01106205.1~~GEMP01106205.1.p1  ORF type:complete len:124 (+),score=39.05 GEMP01106205.1:273-644(+)